MLDGPAAIDTPPFEASNAAAAVAVTSQDEGRVVLSKTTLIFLNIFLTGTQKAGTTASLIKPMGISAEKTFMQNKLSTATRLTCN